MISIKNERGECELQMNGNLAQIIAEVVTSLHTIYNAIYEDSPAAAEHFAQAVVIELVKPDSIIFEPNKKEGEQE